MADFVQAISGLTFERWCANHAPDHGAKWCRELYPWQIFARADYSNAAMGAAQAVSGGGHDYQLVVKNKAPGRLGRTEITVHLTTPATSGTKTWKHGMWDDAFKIIAAPDSSFITLFTVKPDPSKVALVDFMRGRLDGATIRRWLPLSALFFRSLIANLAEGLGPLLPAQEFPVLAESIRSGYREHPEIKGRRVSSYPLLSRGRDLWVMHGFVEEKGHRVALFNESQCRRLVVVYCHPTLSRHHRSTDARTEVLSLVRFAAMCGADRARRLLPQIRFLTNHMRSEALPVPSQSEHPDAIIRRIQAATDVLQIETSELREAAAAMALEATSFGDIAYILAAANVLNAAMDRNRRFYRGSVAIPKEAYAFKARLAVILENLADAPIEGVSMHFAPDGLTLVTAGPLQFSFHAIPRSARIKGFMATVGNKKQDWQGLRLQPIAPLVLSWGREMFTRA